MTAWGQELEQHTPGRDRVADAGREPANPSSQWLPADWVAAALEDSDGAGQVVEIQPGVRWLPRNGPVTTLIDVAPVRPIALPRLRWRQISWPHRRQLLAVAVAALALAAPIVLGGLGSTQHGTASHPAARSPFAPALATPAPGLHGGGGGKSITAPVRSSGPASPRFARAGSAVAAASGSHATLSGSDSSSSP